MQVISDGQATAALVDAYSGSDAYKAMCRMLDALIESYKLDLMHVTPDGLTRLQALIQQSEAIRLAVSGERKGFPKI